VSEALDLSGARQPTVALSNADDLSWCADPMHATHGCTIAPIANIHHCVRAARRARKTGND